MSRELPERPNLLHLKQQAKDRLVDLRRDAPDAQLADALHVVASDYGFTSWPELKAHVERLSTNEGMPAAGRHSLAGRWAASGASLGNLGVIPAASAALEFTIVGRHVRIIQWAVDESGREVRGTSTVDVDGEEHRYADTSLAVRAQWSDRTLEVSTTVEGRPASQVRYSLAEDGGSLTLSTSGVDGDGVPAAKRQGVFARQTFR